MFFFIILLIGVGLIAYGIDVEKPRIIDVGVCFSAIGGIGFILFSPSKREETVMTSIIVMIVFGTWLAIYARRRRDLRFTRIGLLFVAIALVLGGLWLLAGLTH
jgi:uncharacterized membrane protein YhaH (DUF805 family)